jgi:hypothetical protein
MKALLLVGAMAAAMPSVSLAECVSPQTPAEPPSGATATREEMLAAQGVIKGYNAAIVAYTECLRKGGGDLAKDNEAVASLKRIADRFNAELRIFKQRNVALAQ